MLACLAAVVAFPLAARAAQTVVSIEFDDTNGEQTIGASLLESHGMRGTFFVNSPRFGWSGYLTLDQVRAFQASGHEIGGHTLDHVDLTTLSSTDQHHQICDDRTALLGDGLSVSSFAYPFGAVNSSARQTVIDCGYSSGRGVGNLPSSLAGETVPPPDPFDTRTYGSVQSTTSLSTLEGWVTKAEANGGGWIQVVIHHICDNCDTYAISQSNLDAFLGWLAPRASNGTVVRTVREVLGEQVPPTVSITAPTAGATVSGSVTITADPRGSEPFTSVDFFVDGTRVGTATASPWSISWDSRTVYDGATTLTARATTSSGATATSSGVTVSVSNGQPSPNLLANPSLETGDPVPDCWEQQGYGTNTFAWTRTSDAHAGSWAQRVDVSSYSDGDRKLLVRRDSGTCAPVAVAGAVHTVSGWFKSSGSVRFAAYYRKSDGTWVWWAQGPTLPSASSWTQTSWTLPPLPSDATHFSIGLSLISAGWMVVDDFTLPNTGSTPPPTPPPTVSVAITTPQAGATVSGNVTLAASASSSDGIASVDFFVNGNLVGSATGGTWSITWDSRTVANGTATITARATSSSGATATSSPVSVTVSNTKHHGKP